MTQVKVKLSPAQQKIITLLEQGYVGRFYSKLSLEWGLYTYAALVNGEVEVVVKMCSVRALAKKGLVAVVAPVPQVCVGQFGLEEA